MTESATGRILIIGASRGLGLGLAAEYLARGWQVEASVRDDAGQSRLEAAARETSGHLRVHRLDVGDDEALDKLKAGLPDASLEILFVNAGIAGDPDQPVEAVPADEFSTVMQINALAPLRLIARLFETVRPGGTIAAMSSDMASMALNEAGGWEVYRASKAALNSLLKSFAIRHHGDGRTIVAMSPGWVRTDMGGSSATFDVATSVRGIADTLAARQGHGGFLYVDHLGRDRPT